MHTTVNPQRFQGQEISLSPVARGQSAVVLGGSLTGPSCNAMPDDIRMCGEAAALADAKLQLRHAFDTWLHWALNQEGPVQWHWTEAGPQRAAKEDGGDYALAG